MPIIENKPMLRRIANAIGAPFRWIWRSSQTGRFVSREYAEAHPDVTEKERI